MKEIVVISGKGGTGKTSITAALAALAGTGVLADCDVDAADLHLLTSPIVLQEYEFVGGKRAAIRSAKCRGCGRCYSLCRFGAIEPVVSKNVFRVQESFCEGCRVCVEFCPAGAIDWVEVVSGRWFLSQTRFGPMVHAQLGIAQENSGKLVTLLRKEARRIADEKKTDWVFTDGSPGIGCPVIASLTGADFVLAVTEPTQSGCHDLMRVLELTEHFGISAAVCINKADINPEMTRQIERLAVGKNLPKPVTIPYDPSITAAQIQAQSVIEYDKNSPAARAVSSLWETIQKLIFS
ncbi:MAG TPA: ATP-binding protein [Anaerohalosphaeraceae bacterium]|nr:ATP-binding protein [Anaerohalosphaeraceae bacterium]